LLFTLLALACLAGGAAAVAAGIRQDATPAGEVSAASLAHALDAAEADGGAVVFRSSDADGRRGALAVAALGGGTRTVGAQRCDRVYYAGGRGLCVARAGGFAAGYEADILGPDLRVRKRLGVAGIPSRARVSRDGRLGSVTMFVAGHAYATAGSFSTQTTLIDMTTGTRIADLEGFRVLRGTRLITAQDVNFWGVTFARDDDTFYATLATGGHTYLIRGSIRTRTARVLAENVECPSLSPDETRIAFKRRTASSSQPWRLSVMDLKTKRITPLAETQSVDDQAEWRDDAHVLYGRANGVWEVAADGSGTPRRLLAGASSPAVGRP
jgi:hypothetical protein